MDNQQPQKTTLTPILIMVGSLVVVAAVAYFAWQTLSTRQTATLLTPTVKVGGQLRFKIRASGVLTQKQISIRDASGQEQFQRQDAFLTKAGVTFPYGGDISNDAWVALGQKITAATTSTSGFMEADTYQTFSTFAQKTRQGIHPFLIEEISSCVGLGPRSHTTEVSTYEVTVLPKTLPGRYTLTLGPDDSCGVEGLAAQLSFIVN